MFFADIFFWKQNLGPWASYKAELTDWLTESLYYDIWQTADKITMQAYV